MTHETPNAPKKPYTEPRLLVYGDIREITKHGRSRWTWGCYGAFQ